MRRGLIVLSIIWGIILFISVIICLINPADNDGLEIFTIIVAMMILFGIFNPATDAISIIFAILAGCLIINIAYSSCIEVNTREPIVSTHISVDTVPIKPPAVKTLSYDDTRMLIRDLTATVDYCFKVKIELTTLSLDKPITEVDGARLRDTILTCEKQRLQSKVNQIN